MDTARVEKLSGREIRAMRKRLAADNAKYPIVLREVPMSDWPMEMKRMALSLDGSAPIRAWRSKWYAAMLFDEGEHKPQRLTVNRTAIDDSGRYAAGITWDELMQVKRECGFGQRDALELFPADRDLVDVQNMRHVWILTTQSRLNWCHR